MEEGTNRPSTPHQCNGVCSYADVVQDYRTLLREQEEAIRSYRSNYHATSDRLAIAEETVAKQTQRLQRCDMCLTHADRAITWAKDLIDAKNAEIQHLRLELTEAQNRTVDIQAPPVKRLKKKK